MRITHSSDTVLIVDDLLDMQDAQYIWRYIQSETFEHVHRLGWINAWRLTDGVPLRGPVTLSHTTPADPLTRVFPVDLAIDLVIEAIINMEEELARWIGKRPDDWSHFFCRPYIYPAGAGLAWHDDNQHNCTGAFTYYCHPEWNIAWGGELLAAPHATLRDIQPASMGPGEQQSFGSHLDNSHENEVLLEEATGLYILPKPNRLVVMGGGIVHCIKKVDSAAGSNVRASLQGTFMHPLLSTGTMPAKTLLPSTP